MIEVEFSTKRSTKIFLMKGHANYADAGTDIVCAAASAIAITSLKAMSKFLGCLGYKLVEKDGYLHLTLMQSNETVDLLLENLKETLKELETQFPDHIKVKS